MQTFKAACLEALTEMAQDQGFPAPEQTALGAWNEFEISMFELPEYPDLGMVSPSEQEDFTRWWFYLCPEQKTVVTCGSDITEANSALIRMLDEDTGEVVDVGRKNYAILCTLFNHLGI